MSQVNPLARTWKTTEGVVTIGLGTLIGVVSGFDPSALPHKWAGALLTVQAVALLAARSWVKANGVAASLYHANEVSPAESQAALLAEAEAVSDPETPAPVVGLSPAIDPANPPVQKMV